MVLLKGSPLRNTHTPISPWFQRVASQFPGIQVFFPTSPGDSANPPFQGPPKVREESWLNPFLQDLARLHFMPIWGEWRRRQGGTPRPCSGWSAGRGSGTPPRRSSPAKKRAPRVKNGRKRGGGEAAGAVFCLFRPGETMGEALCAGLVSNLFGREKHGWLSAQFSLEMLDEGTST